MKNTLVHMALAFEDFAKKLNDIAARMDAADTPEAADAPAPAPAAEKKVTLEMVRELLIKKDRAQVKSYLTSVGVRRLSDIPKEKLADALAAGQKMKDMEG